MRLIEAYSAKEALEYALVGDTASMAERVIDSQPTVDAVPVVRCWECKHYDTADFDGNTLCGCTLHSAMLDITPDSFCSYGERKGGAD